MSRWRRFDRMPLRIDSTLAAETYIVVGIGSSMRTYGASTYTEAQSIAQRLRKDEHMQFVGIYHIDEAWRRYEQ